MRRKNDDRGTDLLGCVLPRGRVYKVASSANFETTVSSYKLKQIAGAVVLIADFGGSQYGSSSGMSVWNLRSGRSYTIAEHCTIGDGSLCRPGEDATASAALVNRRGQAAAAIVPTAANATAIVGFSSRGERRGLDFGPSDQVPAASLRLTGNVVSWMHSGAARSATLDG